MQAVECFPLNNGMYIPACALGTWLAEPHLVGNAVKIALQNGYHAIDSAAAYENEQEVHDEGFKPIFEQGKLLREEVFITSKLWINSKEKSCVRKACEDTLSKLGCKYLDLYLIHWPVSLRQKNNWPPQAEDFINVPIQETWAEMEKLVEDGLVKSIGVSNFTIAQLKELLAICKIKPVINQCELHVFNQQPKLCKFCADNHIHVTAYSPLGNNGNPDRRTDIPNLLEYQPIVDIAKKYNKTAAQICLRFLIQEGHSVLPKSTKEERIKSNFDIFDFKISEEDMQALRGMDKKYRTCQALCFFNGKS